MTDRSPLAVRRAAALVGAQGAVATVAAVVFLVRGIFGADRHIVNGFGNAAWFGMLGVAVLAAAWALWTGRQWGRGIAVFTQLLILPVCWYVGVGSHRWVYAVPIAVVALVVLALLFSPSTIQWLTSRDSAASRESSGPVTR